MRRFIIFVAAALLTACATHGRPITQGQIDQIQKGQTTGDELLNNFGKPIVHSKNSDGTEIIGWAYAKVGFAGSSYENRSLTVTLGPDGKVVSFTTSDMSNPYQ